LTERIRALPFEDRSTALKTGFDTLDDAIGGMMPGEIVLVGARPLIGKGWFAVKTAAFIGSRPDCGVLYIKMEEGGVFSFPQSVNVCYEHRIPVVYLRNLLEEKTPRFVAIDCLQLLSEYPKGKGIRCRHRVEALLDQLKQLALEFGVPMLITTRLIIGKEVSLQPSMENIPFGSSLISRADTCLLLHRKALVVDEPLNDDWKYMYADICKAPGGRQETVRFRYI